jgi:hypothetical protein
MRMISRSGYRFPTDILDFKTKQNYKIKIKQISNVNEEVGLGRSSNKHRAYLILQKCKYIITRRI